MEKFIEIENWGFNSIIISSLITVLFTFLQGYGIIKQAQKIWRSKSVKSLSTFFFFFLFFYFIILILYGLNKNSLTMIFNGLLVFTSIPVVVGILKFKTLSFIEKISIPIMMLMIPAMIVVKNKDVLFFIILFVSWITLLFQLINMIREKSRGSIEIKFILIQLITVIFWSIYSFGIKNWPLEIFNFTATITYILFVFFYKKYKYIEMETTDGRIVELDISTKACKKFGKLRHGDIAKNPSDNEVKIMGVGSNKDGFFVLYYLILNPHIKEKVCYWGGEEKNLTKAGFTLLKRVS